MKELSVDPEMQILNHRVTAVEETLRDAIGEIRDGIREIAANTGKLAVLEERHAETRGGLERAFDEIKRVQVEKCETSACDAVKASCQSLEHRVKTVEGKVADIETAMPGLKEIRTWLITLAGVVILSVVGALIALVVRGS